VLRERLRTLAGARGRFGYRRLHILLRREGVELNHKKLFRIYREERLTVRRIGVKAQEQLRQNACSGAVFAFRGVGGDRIKLLHWDGQGFCLYYKILEKGAFPERPVTVLRWRHTNM